MARKNGEGSITRLKDGRYQVRISLQHGKRRALYAQTEQEAVETLAKLRAAKAQLPELNKETLASVVGRWLETVKDANRINTYVNYHYIFDKHVLPRIARPATEFFKAEEIELGTMRIGHLTGHHIEKWLRLMKDVPSEARPGVFKPRGSRVRRLAFTLLRKVLAHAITPWRLISSNPCEGIKPPRATRVPMSVWSSEQVAAFVLHIQEDDTWGALFELAFSSGMRIGELLGLQWKDLDLTARTVTIQQQLIQVQSHAVGLDDVKTMAARRVIEVPKRTAALLVQHKARAMRAGLLTRTPFVFVTKWANPMLRGNVRKAFYRISRQLGLPRIRIHDIRHTHATLLLAAGMDPKTVAERLGHADPKITMSIYAHVTPAMRSRAVDLITEALNGGNGTGAVGTKDEGK